MCETTDYINRNASPSSYGWAFQVGAGIVLMLDNVKQFNSIRLEGRLEDIEISFDDGKIYAQAKSVTRIGDARNVSANLNKALDTLKDDVRRSLENVKELIYITNIYNPLGSEFENAFKYGQSYSFSVLPEDAATKIRNKVGEDFPLNKFKLYMLHFYGEEETKFSAVKAKIEEFLREAIDDTSYSKRVLSDWFEKFLINSTDKPDEEKCIVLKKDKVVWPILVAVTDVPISETSFSNVSDSDNYYEICQQYRKIINSNDLDFQFVTGVMHDYTIERQSAVNKAMFKYEFIKNNWDKYVFKFSSVKDETIKEDLTKFTMLSIIEKRTVIARIKEAANLK